MFCMLRVNLGGACVPVALGYDTVNNAAFYACGPQASTWTWPVTLRCEVRDEASGPREADFGFILPPWYLYGPTVDEYHDEVTWVLL